MISENKDKRNKLLDSWDFILRTMEKEKRATLTADEDRKIRDLKEKIAALDQTIIREDELRDLKNGWEPVSTSMASRSSGYSGGPFRNFGDQLQAVQRAAFRGSQPDARLFEVAERAASGMNESSPAEGAFLVQSDFSTQLLDRVYAASQVASRCQHIPISGSANGIKMPRLDESSRATGSRFGGVTGYWIAEAGSISGTKPKLASTELNLKKVAALVYSTDELLADSAALSSFVPRVAGAELAWQLDNRIINGSGVGCPLGIINAPATIEVPKEAMQAADSVIIENVLAMYGRLPASSIANAAWYVSQSVLPQLYSMTLVAGVGGAPVFMPAGGISGKPYNSLLGLPVVPIEHAAKLGDKGDVMLCDMSRYLLGTKGGVQSSSSIHVLFDSDQMLWRFIMRVDGQPDVQAPMTPWNGGPTESPFLVLQAR